MRREPNVSKSTNYGGKRTRTQAVDDYVGKHKISVMHKDVTCASRMQLDLSYQLFGRKRESAAKQKADGKCGMRALKQEIRDADWEKQTSKSQLNSSSVPGNKK